MGSGPSDLQEELMRVLSKAVQELELTWSHPEVPVRSNSSGISGPHGKLTRGRRSPSSPMYTSSW